MARSVAFDGTGEYMLGQSVLRPRMSVACAQVVSNRTGGTPQGRQSFGLPEGYPEAQSVSSGTHAPLLASVG